MEKTDTTYILEDRTLLAPSQSAVQGSPRSVRAIRTALALFCKRLARRSISHHLQMRNQTQRERGGKHKTSFRGLAARRCLHILKLAVLVALVTIAAPAVFAADVLGPSAGSVNQLQALGSVKDYASGDPGSVGESEDQVPILGIEIANGQSQLAPGSSISGIKVISVNPDSPAAIAGLQNEQAAVRTALMVLLAAGGMVFPPAMFGAMLMGQSDIGESHDLIIAVDGERTRNIADLQDTLDRAEDGEIVYLVILRAGHRQHIAVRLPGELPPSTQSGH
jgi:hypothetical protein